MLGLNLGLMMPKNRLPRTGLLFYAPYPNAVLDFNWDDELDWDQQLLGYSLPETDAVRAATGWVSGQANFWFDADGNSIKNSASAILKLAGINTSNIWFTVSKGLAIFSPDISDSIIRRIAGYYRLAVPEIFYPSAFFNGLNFDLATYTGGPTYVPDHLGVLRSPGTNLAACEGFPLATTVEDGAVLGPEKIVNGYFNIGDGWTLGTDWSISGGSAICTGMGSYTTLRPSAPISYIVGRTVRFSVDVTLTSGVLRLFVFGVALPNIVVSGHYEYEIIATVATDTFQIQSRSPSFVGTVDNVSTKEVIPTYLATDESGNPILPSTPQKTVTYSTDWLSKTFAETFSKFDISDPLKAPGWLCEPVRTNYALNSAVPATHTTGTIAAGTYTLWQEGTGSIVATAGTAIGTFGTASNGTPATITITTPGTVVLTASGTNTWVQLEGGTFKTSRIYTTTAPMVRAATIASFPTEGKIPVNNFAIRMIVVPRVATQFASMLFSSYPDINNRIRIVDHNDTIKSVLISITKSGFTQEIQTYYDSSKDIPYELIAIKHTTGAIITVREYIGNGLWTSWVSSPKIVNGITTGPAPISSTYQLGAMNGTNQFTGNISSFECEPIPAGTTDPMAWAKAHWGVA